MVRAKFRLHFQKSGDLRWISHHDLMRAFERMMRRANLRFATTKGFNPKPRMVFAMPLPLGIIGLDEIVHLEFDEEISAEELLARLHSQTPPGLSFHHAALAPEKDTQILTFVVYRLSIPDALWDNLCHRMLEVLAMPSCPVTRTKPQLKNLDVRPYIAQLTRAESNLEMTLRVTAAGTARPEEIVRLLDLESLTAAGTPLERLRLVFEEKPTVPPVNEPGATVCHSAKDAS